MPGGLPHMTIFLAIFSSMTQKPVQTRDVLSEYCVRHKKPIQTRDVLSEYCVRHKKPIQTRDVLSEYCVTGVYTWQPMSMWREPNFLVRSSLSFTARQSFAQARYVHPESALKSLEQTSVQCRDR